MDGGRPRRAVATLLVLVCLAAGCAASPRTRPQSSSPSGAWSIVALGDSVPRGTNCDCTPYPPLTADGLSTDSAHVTATNDSVAGATTSTVLAQLDRSDVIDHVKAAHVVEIEVGANDVAYSQSCGNDVACYAPKIPTIEKNLAAIVARVHELTAGHQVLVVLLDYWSVWLGGQYAAAKGDAYVAAAEQVTGDVNSVIKSTAAAGGSAYVDLRAAFKGPTYSYDETHYLSDDGDHPNAAGHQQIATATEAVIKSALHI
jgi:lysophospholipase L1-like esterase